MSKIPKFGKTSSTLEAASKESSGSVFSFKTPDFPSNSGKRDNDTKAFEVKKLNTAFSSMKLSPRTSIRPPAAFRKQSSLSSFGSTCQTSAPYVFSARESMPATSTVFPRAKPIPKTEVKAWDLKGKVRNMEEKFERSRKHNEGLENKLQTYNQRISTLESANSQLHQDVEVKSVQSREATSKVERLKEELKKMSEEVEKLKVEKDSIQSRCEDLKPVANSLKRTVSSLIDEESRMQAKLDSGKHKMPQQRQKIEELRRTKASLESERAALRQRNEELKVKQGEDESERKMSLITLQNLKKAAK